MTFTAWTVLDSPRFVEGFNEQRAEKLEKNKKAYDVDKRGKSRRLSITFSGCDESMT